MRNFVFLLTTLVVLPAGAFEKRALGFEDFFQAERIGHLAVSPDGTRALFRVQQAQIEDNGYTAGIFMIDLERGAMTRMTPVGEACGSPAWRPDGEAFAYTCGGRLFVKTLDGAAARLVTETEASGPVFSPDGDWLLFVSTVSVREEADHSGKVIDELFFRQWNAWVDDHRQHVFITRADGKGEPRDLTPGDANSPPLDLGSGQDYSFSPDGKKVVVVKNTEEMVAASTNNDIFEVDLETGEETRITTHEGGDAEPVYSPDGRWIAYWSMARPGFEADRHLLHLYDRKTGRIRALDHQGDHDAGDLEWSPDSKSIYYTTREEGARAIYRIGIDGGNERLADTYTHGNLELGGNRLVFTRESTTRPAEIYTMPLDGGEARRVTDLNGDWLAEIEMNDWEPFWYETTNGARVQGFVIRPPFFDEGERYPMTFLIHGGPQGMWSNNWHYRWNAQMFAARGNAVVLINPHGSKGYGQAFCDAVTRDWGGQPFEDLMKGLEVAIARFPFIDPERVSAAGASYGGYMINWIAGQKDHPFKALVSHNGIFNLVSMAFATEELWFTEWEMGGTYTANPDLYEKWSPHRLAGNFHAPMLVIHSEKDYRVPINQGIELFTAHQRQGITSRWLYFPDEDHFVSKPKNARMWWRTVYDWIETHGNKGKPSGS